MMLGASPGTVIAIAQDTLDYVLSKDIQSRNIFPDYARYKTKDAMFKAHKKERDRLEWSNRVVMHAISFSLRGTLLETLFCAAGRCETLKVGSCLPLCCVALVKLIKTITERQLDIRFELFNCRYFDHAFIVLNRPVEFYDEISTWDNNVIILDPWIKKVFPANEKHIYWKDVDRLFGWGWPNSAPVEERLKKLYYEKEHILYDSFNKLPFHLQLKEQTEKAKQLRYQLEEENKATQIACLKENELLAQQKYNELVRKENEAKLKLIATQKQEAVYQENLSKIREQQSIEAADNARLNATIRQRKEEYAERMRRQPLRQQQEYANACNNSQGYNEFNNPEFGWGP